MIKNEVRGYLENLGFGTSNIDLFDTTKPTSPDNLIIVEDVLSIPLDESNALSVDNIGIMIIVRNTSADNAQTIIWNIHKKLIGFSGKLIPDGHDITYFMQESPPHGIGRDDENRMEYEVTYNVRVQTTASDFRL